MVEEILVGDYLSDEMIDFGTLFIALLDNNKLCIKAALWFYYSENKLWRFIIAMPGFDSEGPKHAYKKVLKVLNNMSDPKISLQNIQILDTSSKLILLLKMALKTDDSISGIRFTRNSINGILIEDAYIYRMNP